MKDEEKKKHPKEGKDKNKKDKCECHGKEECKCQEQHEEQKIKDLEEALLRKDADMINYRKRKDEEVTKMLMYSKEDI